jgi:hypothetical protein
LSYVGKRSSRHGRRPPYIRGHRNATPRHAVAKATFGTLDYLAWWRVIRMLAERHHWRWKDVRRWLVGPTGSWRPITAGKTELRPIAAIPVTGSTSTR